MSDPSTLNALDTEREILPAGSARRGAPGRQDPPWPIRPPWRSGSIFVCATLTPKRGA
jgi:hypothetical protein